MESDRFIEVVRDVYHRLSNEGLILHGDTRNFFYGAEEYPIDSDRTDTKVGYARLMVDNT